MRGLWIVGLAACAALAGAGEASARGLKGLRLSAPSRSLAPLPREGVRAAVAPIPVLRPAVSTAEASYVSLPGPARPADTPKGAAEAASVAKAESRAEPPRTVAAAPACAPERTVGSGRGFCLLN